MNDADVERVAIEFAKAHKKEIAKELTDRRRFPPDAQPVSVFMAGSPGAGKTESSRRLIERFSSDGHSILRIDADDLRSMERLPTLNVPERILNEVSSMIASCRYSMFIKIRYRRGSSCLNAKRRTAGRFREMPLSSSISLHVRM